MGFEVAPKQEGSWDSESSSASLISAFAGAGGGPGFDLISCKIYSESVGLSSAAELVAVAQRVTGKSRMSSAHDLQESSSH